MPGVGLSPPGRPVPVSEGLGSAPSESSVEAPPIGGGGGGGHPEKTVVSVPVSC